MGFVLTAITIMLALDALWIWLSDRLLRTVRHASAMRLLNAAFVGVQLLAIVWIVVGRLMRLDPSASAPKPLFAAVLLWHLIVLPVSLVFLAIPSIALAWGRRSGAGGDDSAATRRVESERDGNADPSPVIQPALSTRRSFLRTAAVVTPPFVTTIATIGSMPQLEHFRVRRLTLDLPTLPRGLDGMTIAHVTDIHVGRFTHGPILHRILAATNQLEADLVLLTGDLINDSLGYLDEALDLVKQMRPRRGLAMCEGNHDLIESRDEFETRTRASGVPLLINESAIVRVRDEPIQLLGLRWGRATPGGTRTENSGDAAIASSMDATLRHLRADGFPILLAHHPHAFDPAAAAGIPLTLAGHTHGGQLMLTKEIGFGPQMYRYWSGPYQKGDAAIVVSNGVGNWFPLRINAPAEIIHLTLRRA